MYRVTTRGLFSLTVLVAACQSQNPGTTSPSNTGSQSQTLGAGQLTANVVQNAIAAQGAGWTAGETSVSDLPLDARKRRLGVPLSKLPTYQLDLTPDTSAAATTLPAVFDWRNNNGQNFVSPILDQGDCGSCVAFATTGTFETQMNIAAGDTTSPFELSPQYLFSCGGGACDFGWDGDSAAQFLTSTGMPDDACLPYSSGSNDQDVSCSAACSNSSQRVLKASNYTTPSSSITAVKTALLNGPLVTTMTVYDDFMYYTSGVYKHVTGDVDGGHAVSIIGWSDTDQAWICRNSWGTTWGENGFFEIAYTDVSGVGAQTWSFTVAAPANYASLVGVRDGEVMASNSQALSFETKGLSNAQVSWSLAPNNNGSPSPSPSATGSANVLDTTTVQDGVYLLQAQATSGSQTVSSEPRLVSILNGTETGTIQFTGMSADQTVSGVFNIPFSVSVQPIPLTGVIFHVADSTGTLVSNDTLTGNTSSSMQIDWDTTRHANGKYTVSVIGVAGSQQLPPASIAVTISN